MKKYGFTLLLLWAQSGISQVAMNQLSTGQGPYAVSPQADFFGTINKRVSATVPKEVKFVDLPDSLAVIKAVQRPACAVAVGGRFADFVVPRFENTKYWAYWIVTARRVSDDRLLVLIGWSNPDTRDVALAQSYWQPTSAFIEVIATGTIERIDLLPHMEKALGFKRGSLTKKIFRVLHLLHEHGHLNAAIPRDDASLRQSMLNTRRIAEACYPEIVEPIITNTDGGRSLGH
jgi:hypothetical protein